MLAVSGGGYCLFFYALVPGTGMAAAGGVIKLYSISCGSPGNCRAGGYGQFSPGQRADCHGRVPR